MFHGMKKMKKYTKPQIAVVQCECNTILAVSELKYSDEEANTSIEALSGKRRGTWGNLWEK